MKSPFLRILCQFHLYKDENYWKGKALSGGLWEQKRAIPKLSNLASLECIIKRADNGDVIRLAKQRWANIIIHQVDIDDFQAEQAVLNCADEERLSYLVNQTDNSNVGILAFYGLRSESVLLDLMLRTNCSRLIPAIVGKLQSRAALETALAHTIENLSEPKYAKLIEEKILQLSAI